MQGDNYQPNRADNRFGNAHPPAGYQPPRPVAAESVYEFDLNSPVDILSYEISTQPDRTGVAVTMKNNLDQPVAALRFEVSAANEFGEPVSTETGNSFELLAQDLKGAPGMVFRTVGWLWLPDPMMRKLCLRVKQICLLGGEVIDIPEAKHVTVEMTMVESADLLYLNQKMPRARYYPKQEEGYWVCSCGRPNKEERETCLECRENKRDVFDVNRMIDMGRTEFKREEERRRIAERQRQEEQARRRRRNMVITVTVVVLLALAGGAYVFIQKSVMPDLNYNRAVAAFEEGDYEKAMKLFGANRDYKDSDELYAESTYQRGLEAFDAGDYDDARFLFGSIVYYKDSSDYMERIYDILYPKE